MAHVFHPITCYWPLLFLSPSFQIFSISLRHGYMPKLLRDCIVVPVPKPHKDPSLSDNYRPIALAPNLSKVLERCILQTYSSSFVTTDLQFGFKPGFSTGLCTGVLKNVVSSYINRGSKVFSCFLDASKAFDRVNHDLLFKILLDRQLPNPDPILRFLFSWYGDLSSPFGVRNGVRQGGVLSPILFTVYMMNCSQDFQHLKLAAILGITLWVHFVTLMILPFWLLHRQLFAFCC